MKRFAIDLLTIETEHNFKYNIHVIFNEEDKLYREADKTCHICKNEFINKVRGQCHEIGKYGGLACNLCNLREK